MSPPRFTLLVPCFNAATFLPRLWETVRAQTLPFDEIVCYDDASTDATADVARALGARVLRGESNVGPGAARNHLWRAATSDWVHFHDADDLLHPRFLEKMSARATAATDVVICDADWQHEHDRRTFISLRYSESELLAAPAAYLLTHPVGGINGLYLRAALAAVDGFDARLRTWEDADLHVRLALHGARFAVVSEPLVVSLRRGDSTSAALSPSWLNRLGALESYAALSTAPGFAAALAVEAERAASAFAFLGEPVAARRALALCHRLGARPPTTRQPLLRALKPFVSAVTLLRWQAMWRERSAARA